MSAASFETETGRHNDTHIMHDRLRMCMRVCGHPLYSERQSTPRSVYVYTARCIYATFGHQQPGLVWLHRRKCHIQHFCFLLHIPSAVHAIIYDI